MSTGSLQVDQRAGARSMSPDLPMLANGTYPMAKGAPEPMLKAKDPEFVFTEEELRHFSSNIAKDCDEAFKSSLIEDESIAGSLCDADRKQRDSPFTFSMENSPTMTPATEMSLKTWDSRPLPPLPSEKALHSPPAMSPRTQNSSFTTLADMDDVEHVAQIAVPIRVGKYADRRVMSAPIQTHSSRRLGTMPPINENTAVNVVSNDKSRIVSAPPHTPPKRFNGQARGIEYLSRVENSIRVVHSPNGPSPVKIPKPLNIQKRSAVKEGTPRNADDAYTHGAEHDGDGVSGHNREGEINTMRKKRSWFSRSSKAQSDSGTRSLRGSHGQLTLVGSDADERDIAPGGISTKKKSFTFPFLKKNRSPELRMSIAGKFYPKTIFIVKI
jgi:serine/threonine-protein kinase HSL1 (negative regulator of Swe1 kinase)